MRVVILSARTGWHTDELIRALTERGHLAAVLRYEGLIGRIGVSVGAGVRARPADQASLTSEQISILDADAVLARIIPGGSLEQLIYRVDALHWIENRGIRVINSPRVIERSVDKFYTTTLLHDAGLLVPETVVCERVEDAMAAVRTMGDVVIKPIFGSLGHGMVRVSDPDTALRVVRALDQIRSVFYVQRAIDHSGRDLRVFVVGGRVLGAIERRAPAGEWRTNVAIGGAATAVEISSDIEQVALRAASAVGADYAGVDVLPARDGSLYVLEVNGIPGWQGLQRATGLDVAASIVTHLERVGSSSHTSEETLPA